MTDQPMRRVYYFIPPEHALENLEKRHLKVSRFSKCNDAFELAIFDLSHRELRTRFSLWLNFMDLNTGLLCFCRTWRNPVLWGHYARNHTGLCLGFDIDPKEVADVKYVSERLYPGVTLDTFPKYVGESQMTEFFSTKFIHWSYEEEVRLLVRFPGPSRHEEMLFYPFSSTMELKEVIVGPRSEIKARQIRDIIPERSVDVFKSRLAFRTFSVVRQRDKSKW